MKYLPLWFVCGLTFVAGYPCQSLWAQAAPAAEAAEQADDPKAKEQVQEQDQDQPKAEAPAKDKAPAGKKPIPQRREIPPRLPAVRPPGQLQLPEQLPRPVQRPQPKFGAVPPAAANPLVNQNQQVQPQTSNRFRSSFWSPRQRGLSTAASYHLRSMGPHVHLSPAMRWHMNRAAISQQQSTNTARPAQSSTPGQGAEMYYPSVSRLPTEKPFANQQRPPGGLETYWPLLLEGRQDPNTGLIIWTLP